MNKEIMIVDLEDKIYLEKYDLHIYPFLTFDEIQKIVNANKHLTNLLDRVKGTMIDTLIVICPEIFDIKNDIELTVEDIVYSGLWNDIMSACPNVRIGWNYITQLMDYETSAQGTIVELLNKFSNTIDKVAKLVDNGEIDTNNILEFLGKKLSSLSEKE